MAGNNYQGSEIMKRISSLKRRALICQALGWKSMSKAELQDYLWEKMQDTSSESIIEKHIHFLRTEFDAPIKYSYMDNKYYMDGKFNFIEALTEYLRT